jgi:chromosome segregation ATPase
MSGYFDPNAEAQMNGFSNGMLQGREHGRREGHNAGFVQGQQDGYNIGYLEGNEDGYDKGWNEAIDRANIEIRKQMEFTRQHIADKEALSKRVEEQQRLIEQLTAKLDDMERENASLKGANVELRRVVDALRTANEQLRQDVATLDDKLKQRTQEYSDHLWQYNRCAVFMNSVRSVLEDLTTESTSQAQHVRTLFSKHYAQQVESALQRGVIRQPLDTDETLAKTMPRVAKFMADMLRSVDEHGPKHLKSGNEPAPQEWDEESPSM